MKTLHFWIIQFCHRPSVHLKICSMLFYIQARGAVTFHLVHFSSPPSDGLCQLGPAATLHCIVPKLNLKWSHSIQSSPGGILLRVSWLLVTGSVQLRERRHFCCSLAWRERVCYAFSARGLKWKVWNGKNYYWDCCCQQFGHQSYPYYSSLQGHYTLFGRCFLYYPLWGMCKNLLSRLFNVKSLDGRS